MLHKEGQQAELLGGEVQGCPGQGGGLGGEVQGQHPVVKSVAAGAVEVQVVKTAAIFRHSTGREKGLVT